MAKIHIMTDALASKVAAGEVVERPASVVKELIENSIDAGAKSICVEIEKGGTVLIKVTDDGCGMNREDAILAIERHATSKLRNASDLSSLSTYGFRGEALPSIGSVSSFRLASCEQDTLVGTEILIEGGKLIDVGDSGISAGTEVEIRNLFYNVPARRKFLKAQATEFGHIEEVVRVAAIISPGIAFTLRHGSRDVLRLAGTTRPLDRIADLVGLDLIDHLIEFNGKDEGNNLTVSGWVSEPGYCRRNRKLQYIFLNGRPIDCSAVAFALKDAYAGIIDRGAFPSAFVFIEASPSTVDVNVHPTKREVRFHNHHAVQQLLASSVQQAITSNLSNELTGAAASKPKGFLPPSDIEEISSSGGQELESQPLKTDHSTSCQQNGERSTLEAWNGRIETDTQLEIDIASSNKTHTILGILDRRYLLIDGQDGLILLHRRAAHERILYEEAMRNAEMGIAAAQSLLVPVTVNLPARECLVVMENVEALSSLGLRVEPFGENTIKIDALPASCSGADPVEFFIGLAGELCEGGTKAAQRFSEKQLAAILSSRAARYSEAISKEELNALVTRLMECDMPYCDVRGRPTMIQFSSQELERRFSATPGKVDHVQ